MTTLLIMFLMITSSELCIKQNKMYIEFSNWYNIRCSLLDTCYKDNINTMWT